jgi:ribosomal protein L11 methyltransferase
VSTHGLIEISLSGLDATTAAPVIDLFDRWGRGGVVVEKAPDNDDHTTIKTFLLTEDDKSLSQIEIGLELLKQAGLTSSPGHTTCTYQVPEPRIRFLSESDWAEAWKTGYNVLRVGERLVIKPTWRDYDPLPDDLIIVLDPGMAFGSGLHPTTRLCLEGLEDYLRPGTTVLDVGTGSGVLAIAGARLGASHVLALDTDPLAVRVARENVTLNQAQSVVHVEVGTAHITDHPMPAVRAGPGESSPANLGISKSQHWDLVVVNILAGTIVELAPALAASLAADGFLIASGIIADQAESVLASLRQNKLALLERRDDGEWVALIARKRREHE